MDEPASKGNSNPVVFHEYADGSMWLLRDNFELQRITPEGIQRLQLPAQAGRPGYGLLVPDGKVWLSMRNGIICAKISDLYAAWSGTSNAYDYTFFDESDGMRSPAPNNAGPNTVTDLGPDGIRVATTKGIAGIKPELIRITKIAPNVVIENVIADDTPLPRSANFPAARKHPSSRKTPRQPARRPENARNRRPRRRHRPQRQGRGR